VSRKTTPSRRKNSRSRSSNRSLRLRLFIALCIAVFCVLATAEFARRSAPVANTSLTRFDAIIVLGSQVDRDGNPTPKMLARVTEAVREYEHGVAPRMILTGGPTRKGVVEAEVMQRTAQAQGIPSSAIFVEPRAMDTVQNACYSTRIMQQHGWRSAEIISSSAHLPRTSMIFSHMPLEWRTHAAPSLQPSSAAVSSLFSSLEVLKTARYLVWAQWRQDCQLQ
jgi:uncharacterized SAM-binding protein YcdF (DUF218 family)